MKFQINQIVKGKNEGVFVILGERKEPGFGEADGYQVKPVNPNNHAEHGPGEMWVAAEVLEPIN